MDVLMSELRQFAVLILSGNFIFQAHFLYIASLSVTPYFN